MPYTSRWPRSRPSGLVLPLIVVAAIALATTDGRAAGVEPQVFKTPTGRAENVRVERAPGEVLTVTYDLASDDPQAIFTVALLVSRDSGKTFDLTPRSVTGDVGSGVRAGAGKKIVWEAGKDVESVEMDLFRFSIRTEAANARPVAAVPGPKAGSVNVTSTPPGAAVSVDGQARGVTPVTVSGLAPGEHRVAIARAGYLENVRTVTVEPGQTARVAATLTAVPATPASATNAATAKKGSPLKWLLPLAGGGAAAGVLVAAKGKSSAANPTATTPTYPTSITIDSLSPAPGSTITMTGTPPDAYLTKDSGKMTVGLTVSSAKTLSGGYVFVFLYDNNQTVNYCAYNGGYDVPMWRPFSAGPRSVTITGFHVFRAPCTVTGLRAALYSEDPGSDNVPIAEATRAVTYEIK